ncbi:hypothetical protein KW507_16020 [Vibrio fluvialis]|nr:hypothetical protein [Vibrio fluvialis]MBY8168182.1 hypothetical protein [Vibrio fluvialis]
MIRISKLQLQILDVFVQLNANELTLESLKKEMAERHQKQASSVGRSCQTLAENGYLTRNVDAASLVVSYKITTQGRVLIIDK